MVAGTRHAEKILEAGSGVVRGLGCQRTLADARQSGDDNEFSGLIVEELHNARKNFLTIQEDSHRGNAGGGSSDSNVAFFGPPLTLSGGRVLGEYLVDASANELVTIVLLVRRLDYLRVRSADPLGLGTRQADVGAQLIYPKVGGSQHRPSRNLVSLRRRTFHLGQRHPVGQCPL